MSTDLQPGLPMVREISSTVLVSEHFVGVQSFKKRGFRVKQERWKIYLFADTFDAGGIRWLWRTDSMSECRALMTALEMGYAQRKEAKLA